MDAKKCDRCGDYYTPGIMTKFRVQGRDNLNFNWQPSNVTTFDLCYECSAELEDWMEEKKIKKPTNNEGMVNVTETWKDDSEDQNEPEASKESRE